MILSHSIQMLIHNNKNKVKILKILRMTKLHYKHYRLRRKAIIIFKINSIKKQNEVKQINKKLKKICKFNGAY